MLWALQIRWQIARATTPFLCCLALLADPTPEAALRDYSIARTNYTATSTNTAIAWKFSKACFELAEFATNDTQRASLANEGIAAANHAAALAPEDPAPFFYLAMNIGQLARTKLWTALGLIKEMEKAFLISIKLDEKWDHAAAHRSLGMLYQQAPGWPASIGSRAKSRKHLERAIELAPDYPDNHLSLLEAFAEWGEKEHLRAGLAKYLALLPKAKQKYSGAEWVQPWRDWAERLQALKRKAE